MKSLKKAVAAFLLAVLICLPLSLFVRAEGTDTVEAGDTSDVPRGDDLPAEGETGGDDLTSWIDKISNASFWVSIGSYLVAAVAVLGLVKSKLSVVIDLVKGKADSSTVVSEMQNAQKEISARFREELAAVEDKLATSQDDMQKLLTLFTIFATNAKINPNAKAEIMALLTNVKNVSGSVAEAVDKANAAIAAADAQDKAEEPQTPALDSIVTESASVPSMKLG